jgi:hypothetical protein
MLGRDCSTGHVYEVILGTKNGEIILKSFKVNNEEHECRFVVLNKGQKDIFVVVKNIEYKIEIRFNKISAIKKI